MIRIVVSDQKKHTIQSKQTMSGDDDDDDNDNNNNNNNNKKHNNKMENYSNVIDKTSNDVEESVELSSKDRGNVFTVTTNNDESKNISFNHGNTSSSTSNTTRRRLLMSSSSSSRHISDNMSIMSSSNSVDDASYFGEFNIVPSAAVKRKRRAGRKRNIAKNNGGGTTTNSNNTSNHQQQQQQQQDLSATSTDDAIKSGIGCNTSAATTDEYNDDDDDDDDEDLDDDDDDETESNLNNTDHEKYHQQRLIQSLRLGDSLLTIRILIYSCLSILLLIITITSCIYFYNQQQNNTTNFYIHFNLYSSNIITTIRSNINSIIVANNIATTSIVSYVYNNNENDTMTWPFVLLPNFDTLIASRIQRKHHYQNMTTTNLDSDSDLISFTPSVRILPLVTLDNRNEWEQYTFQQSVLELLDTSLTLTDTSTLYVPFIYNSTTGRRSDDNVSNMTYFLPYWQSSPEINSNRYLINMDALSVQQYSTVLQTLIQENCTNNNLDSHFTISNTEFFDATISNYSEYGPTLSIFQPICENSNGINENIIDNNSKGLVGVLMSKFLLTSLLDNMKSAGSIIGSNEELYVVFRSSNNPEECHTYKVSSSMNVQYIDHRSYNYMNEEFIHHPSINYNFADYTITVYPIQNNNIQSYNPILNAILVFVSFAILICIFAWYNYIVDKRQEALMKQAVKCTAIVSSLFPERVHDRLLKDGGGGGGDGGGNNTNIDLKNTCKRRGSIEFKKKATTTSSTDGSKDYYSSLSMSQESILTMTQSMELRKASNHNSTTNNNNIKNSAATGITTTTTTTISPKEKRSVNENIQQVPNADPTTPTITTGSSTGAVINNKQQQTTTTRQPEQNAATERLSTFLETNANNDAGTNSNLLQAKPIADFFPNTTVLFTDIVGFTAWSSAREASQVFILLQNIFHEFDRAAKRRVVFKVETIGDSYVAVTGLPEPQDDHAFIMIGFALECRQLMRDVTRRLEKTLGPETGDLRMRIGVHSGPVTAGVLRGEKSRFQLFGDTVNTASYLESTGKPNVIHLSHTTAALLKQAGKGDRLVERKDPICVKGKGEMQTFWLDTSSRTRRKKLLHNMSQAFKSSSSFVSGPTHTGDRRKQRKSPHTNIPPDQTQSNNGPSVMMTNSASAYSIDSNDTGNSKDATADNTFTRLVDWNVELLQGLLKKVVAKRQSLLLSSKRNTSVGKKVPIEEQIVFLAQNISKGSTVVDEVAEIITLPAFDPNDKVKQIIDSSSIVLDEAVVLQLREYVQGIAGTYRDNPFHNYEHACHVQMSMMKLLQRVVMPEKSPSTADGSNPHHYTYGITSDPLTQFTVVLCGLLHDCDHCGVSNGQLVKENAHIATLYQGKCVAEQNSIDLAWNLLMDPHYEKLRECIYTDEDEFRRFRQLVVNVVLATDIFDKDLSELRKTRWSKAFSTEHHDEPVSVSNNRKATIVIEHLIQASDVSHTMQHWDIYRKWNERLFYEIQLSFKSGRTETDPATGWYKGELWFFDNYVIPLAKKLNDCKVFGVSSEECLKYAEENRALWEIHGEKIVQEMSPTDYFLKYAPKSNKNGRITRRPKRKNNLPSVNNDVEGS